MTSYRPKEFQEMQLEARWLDEKRARNAYEHALRFSGKTKIGLNEETVYNIEEHIISSESVAAKWVRDRLPNKGTVQIVYGPEEVCVIDTSAFLSNWLEIFAPARDDAMILHNLDNVVMFYYHEEWLYTGRRAL